MSTKIAIITTGGTIGSVIKGKTTGVDESTESLRHEISKICERKHATVEVFSPININSEDLHPVDWATITDQINKCIENGFTKFIVTHGTDTLAYTSTALSYLYSNSGVKICLTGSFYPIEHKESDAPINLLTAFENVLSDNIGNGVFVAFRQDARNKSGNIYRAIDVKPMEYDGVAFEAAYNSRIAYYTAEDGLVVDKKPLPVNYPTFSADGNLHKEMLRDASSGVMIVTAFPGMNLSALDDCIEKFDFIIFSLYHSGTAASYNGSESLLQFIEKHREQVRFLMGAFPAKYINHPYDSTAKIIDAGALVFKDLLPHHLFVFVVLSRAFGVSAATINKTIDRFCVSI